MLTLIKTQPLVMTAVYYDGTNIQDLFDMWGEENVDELEHPLMIYFGQGATVSVPTNCYILNCLGTPIVLDYQQFVGVTKEYFATEQEGHYFTLVRDELLDLYRHKDINAISTNQN